MRGSDDVVDALNRALTIELTAINQYFCQSKMCANWGYERLADYTMKRSRVEMRHAEGLIERILFLEGLPNLQDLGKLLIGENVPECIAGDLKLEQGGHKLYVEAIAYCESIKDYVSREILADILEDTEEHIDYLETQQGLIEQMGLQNYLQSAMGEIKS